MLTLSVMASLPRDQWRSRCSIGPAGLSLVPQPLATTFNVSPVTYSWLYGGFCAGLCLIVYVFVRRITSSPLGRALRTVRENDALLRRSEERQCVAPVQFRRGRRDRGTERRAAGRLHRRLGAVNVGLRRDDRRVDRRDHWRLRQRCRRIFGRFARASLIVQGSTFIPQFGPPELVPALQWILIGRARPGVRLLLARGIIPERLRRFAPERPTHEPLLGAERSGALRSNEPGEFGGTDARAGPCGDRCERSRVAGGERRTGRAARARGSAQELRRREGSGRSDALGPARQITGLIGPNGAGNRRWSA